MLLTRMKYGGSGVWVFALATTLRRSCLPDFNKRGPLAFPINVSRYSAEPLHRRLVGGAVALGPTARSARRDAL
jgi:hypothetical protein